MTTVRKRKRQERAMNHVRARIEFWESFEPEEKVMVLGFSPLVYTAGDQIVKAHQEEINLQRKGIK
jgi:hypothetical protein